jgi:hypothetical protein
MKKSSVIFNPETLSTVYTFVLEGRASIVVEVIPDDRVGSYSENLKEPVEENDSDIAFNHAIDGIESLVMQLCYNSIVNVQNIDKVTDCINEAVSGAANNL